MLRCAYFGCMHPMFEPTHHSQKYCSHECERKAQGRSETKHRANERMAAKIKADPALAKKVADKKARGNYKHIMRRKLPPWMES